MFAAPSCFYDLAEPYLDDDDTFFLYAHPSHEPELPPQPPCNLLEGSIPVTSQSECESEMERRNLPAHKCGCIASMKQARHTAARSRSSDAKEPVLEDTDELLEWLKEHNSRVIQAGVEAAKKRVSAYAKTRSVAPIGPRSIHRGPKEPGRPAVDRAAAGLGRAIAQNGSQEVVVRSQHEPQQASCAPPATSLQLHAVPVVETGSAIGSGRARGPPPIAPKQTLPISPGRVIGRNLMPTTEATAMPHAVGMGGAAVDGEQPTPMGSSAKEAMQAVAASGSVTNGMEAVLGGAVARQPTMQKRLAEWREQRRAQAYAPDEQQQWRAASTPQDTRRSQPVASPSTGVDRQKKPARLATVSQPPPPPPPLHGKQSPTASLKALDLVEMESSKRSVTAAHFCPLPPTHTQQGAAPQSKQVTPQSKPGSSASAPLASRGAAAANAVAKTVQAASVADKEQALKELLRSHNAKFAPPSQYEPRTQSVKQMREWERRTGRQYAALSVEERRAANCEINEWCKVKAAATAASECP